MFHHTQQRETLSPASLTFLFTMASHQGPGGFMLSPPPSSVASSTNSASALPHPRNSPLRPGGPKESAFIRHVDSQILHIQRRFAKRTTDNGEEYRELSDDWGDVKGYSSMKQACKDISELVSVVWISGTPSLQLPYLLNLALLLTTVVSAMPPTPRSLFAVLGKLDHAFASLIQGRDVDTGEVLPGFSGRKGVSGTEKVRIRSLVERTRVGVVEAFKKGEFEFEEAEEVEDRMDTDSDVEGGLVLENGDDDEDDSWDMQLARVYDRTIVELGGDLEEPSIGIITEGRG